MSSLAPPSGPPFGEWESDVVLSDGGTAHIRPVRPDDDDRLDRFYESLSGESRYRRFLGFTSPATAARLEQQGSADLALDCVLIAELGEEIIAVGRYDRGRRGDAEVAFAVRDDQQGRGLGTLLLEHLIELARTRGIRRFVASTFASNHRMLDVFADAGFELRRSRDRDVVEVTFDIDPTADSIAAVQSREHVSEAQSVARLLAPRSIAVVGAGRDARSIGHAIFQKLLDGGFTGPVYAVNARADVVAGVRAFPSIVDIPDGVDLAVVAVPAEQVLDVAHDCARKGVQGLVVISAGFGEVPGGRKRERELIAFARRNGMRVIGPNCMGIVNTEPRVQMNATFAPGSPGVGHIGFASQSGGLGIALLGCADETGLGISTFVSMGNKADVSSNDLLQYWEDDSNTDVILLYLESFGNPRKFARLARRVGARKPIVAVKSGRTSAGARGTSSHTAALATPDVAVDALFRQAGVIRVDTLEELIDTARVLAQQPLPKGRRVAIVSNGGGPGILAADACVAAGLEVPMLREDTQRTLAASAAPGAGVTNPIDLIASATPEVYEQTIRTLLAGDEVDALLVIFVSPIVTKPSDVARALASATAAARADKPVLACFLGHDGPSDGAGRTEASLAVPIFAFPETAAHTLRRIAGYAEWRRRPVGTVPEPNDVDRRAAHAELVEFERWHPDGGWLDPMAVQRLLESYGIPVAAMRWVAAADDAATAASDLGFPVALKAASAELVHKSDVGAVHVGLDSPDTVRAAFDSMAESLGDGMGGAVVQPMVGPGVETIVGVTHDSLFGPLVLFGMGGFQAELLRDTAVRLAPLTDVDARELIRSLRGSPMLFGYRNTPRADVAALEDLVLRVGLLAEALPEIVELDCNPVMVSASGATVVDAKVRVMRSDATSQPDLRRLSAR